MKEFMEENPYWEIFEWHPLNLAIKKSRAGKRYCISCGRMLQDDWNYVASCVMFGGWVACDGSRFSSHKTMYVGSLLRDLNGILSLCPNVCWLVGVLIVTRPLHLFRS